MAVVLVDKTRARKMAQQALADNSTAESAARSVNNNPLNKDYRANHQDNFNPDQLRYVSSNDYAEKAQDNRWLVIIKEPEVK